MYCIVSYCIVSYYIVCIVLYVLYCIVLYCMYCIVLYRIICILLHVLYCIVCILTMYDQAETASHPLFLGAPLALACGDHRNGRLVECGRLAQVQSHQGRQLQLQHHLSRQRKWSRLVWHGRSNTWKLYFDYVSLHSDSSTGIYYYSVEIRIIKIIIIIIIIYNKIKKLNKFENNNRIIIIIL